MIKTLKAGVSTIDISPKKGIELAGYPHFLRHNTGIHDMLYASCIFLDDSITKMAIVCMDILFFSKVYVKEVRERVSSKVNIPEENIMISCSHTHSGPWASGRLDLEGLERGLKPDMDYVLSLKDKLVNLITHACSNTFEAKIGIEKGICGKEDGVGGNRRDPDGPVDPEVWTIGIKDKKDNWRAALIKYSLHPTVIHEESTVVTADYPGYIRKYLAKTKPQMIFLFAQGTSGDQSTRYFRKGQTFKEAEKIGFEIGRVADSILNSMKFTSDVPLIVKSTETDIELKRLSTEEAAEAEVAETKKRLGKLKREDASYIEIQNANLKNLGAECTLEYIRLKNKGIDLELEVNELPAEIQVIGIGDSRIVAVPGEIFVEFGLNIQKRSPFKKTFVITLANGCLPGYACTEEAYSEGDYEAGTSMLTARSGNIIVKAALGLLEETR
ncbi:hypothetical protein ES708_02795 [subsurface metagenome]